MPKTKQQKQATVESLVAGLKTAKGVVFANFQGLTVAQTENLRKEARKAGVSVLAAKKTLIKRALDQAGLNDIDTASFQGGVATFVGADEIASAKVVATFAKKNEIVKIFGGIVDGKFVDAAMVKSLSALPSKLELLGKLVGSLNRPIADFVQVNAGIIRALPNVLNAYKATKA
ncbi:MAG: 50S ribosomal protein L10 [Candidatus Magasanikbacteria bacterium RIFCSPLOWO2_02_FULL_44_11]|uniref:Large ribosomal subunit protein uL10 n=2 Tax=Candidatus Magasanikiibacteriota TaxID=1752731 RepID=A0A1F6NA16_9BACT|nr:MAG: 50S ribosomal protein L10 [Candidatus Magasanikbacteria bacterium RIFCSPHIGHO2_02_FULL_45_10]OGH80764.1 MAG: 50S ribosomal protein L10 [Candidatus Magasanikbacteria bacterium RIFCSPLOWO2_02_FULL_44_11]